MSPSEGGSGSVLSSWASAPFDAAGTFAAQAGMAAELSSFTVFRKRVDDLIHGLADSAAGPDRVGREPLVRHRFGGGDGAWAEAAGLFTAYETVIGELETLSRLLSGCLEGMGIAVLASHKGYLNIDQDVRDRMVAISVETAEHYDGSYAPGLSRQGPSSSGGRTSADSDAGGAV